MQNNTPNNTQINTNTNTNTNNTQNSINTNATTAQISSAGATTAAVQPSSATAAPVFHQPLTEPLPPHSPHPQVKNNPAPPRHKHVKASSLDDSHKMCMEMLEQMAVQSKMRKLQQKKIYKYTHSDPPLCQVIVHHAFGRWEWRVARQDQGQTICVASTCLEIWESVNVRHPLRE